MGAHRCGGSIKHPLRSGGIEPLSSPVPQSLPTSTPSPVATSTPDATITPTPTLINEAFVTQEVASQLESTSASAGNNPTLLYYAQSGDWLPAVAIRFGVDVTEIASPKILPEKGLLDPGTLLIIPDTLDRSVPYTPALQLIPDNEFVFARNRCGLRYCNICGEAGGYLSTYREYLGSSTAGLAGAGAIERVAYENSVNPRLLLALLDYEARWVRGRPENDFRMDYPFGL